MPDDRFIWPIPDWPGVPPIPEPPLPWPVRWVWRMGTWLDRHPRFVLWAFMGWGCCISGLAAMEASRWFDALGVPAWAWGPPWLAMTFGGAVVASHAVSSWVFAQRLRLGRFMDRTRHD